MDYERGLYLLVFGEISTIIFASFGWFFAWLISELITLIKDTLNGP